MAAENDPPSRDSSTSARGRGRGGAGAGRGGRGRGRGGGGRGASSAPISKTSAPVRGGRGGVRRGRAKNFSDPRVQAAYERQRDLKSIYQTVAQALKPALQELAERNIDDLLQNPNRHKEVDEYLPVVSQLQALLEKRIGFTDKRLKYDLAWAKGHHESEAEIIHREFLLRIEDLYEQYYQGQANRLRILNSLHERNLPVDVRDDQYEYKVISDHHFDKEFNLWETFKDGRLVPYPSRVEGTEMWQRARDAHTASTVAVAANAAANELATASGRGRGRARGGGIKRKPNDLPDGPPTPKRSRGADVGRLIDAAFSAPAPAKGLLASAAAVDHVSEGTLGEINSISGTPEPGNYLEVKNQEDIPLRARSPPLPKRATEPDEHNVRVYWQSKNSRDKSNNNRFIVPFKDYFDELDIGFRDSSNDLTRPSMTWAKRGKYMHTSNSDGLHYDWTLANYDYSKLQPDDFDEELVQRHRLHPRYGLFLPESVNEREEPSPYKMPGKPIVFIAQPSGRISHASRSFQQTVNYRREVDAPWRHKFGAALRRFCKLAEIEEKEISLEGVAPSNEELCERSLGVAVQQLEARPSSRNEDEEEDEEEEKEEEEEGGEAATEIGQWDTPANLSLLLEAAQSLAVPEPEPPTPAPKRAYDAIRDAFIGGDEPEEKSSAPPVKEDVSSLNCLADLCLGELPSAAATAAYPLHQHALAPPGEYRARPRTNNAAQPLMSISQPQGPLAPLSRTSITDPLVPPSTERHSMYASLAPYPSHTDSRVSAPESPLQSAHSGRHALLQAARSYPQHPSYGIEFPTSHGEYPPVQDLASREPAREHLPPQQLQHPYSREYPPSSHSYSAPHQEPPSFSSTHSGYSTLHDPRTQHHRPPGRPSDYGYEPYRPTSYGGAEQHPLYSRPYWSEQPPSGPPPPPQGPHGLPSAQALSTQQQTQPYLPPLGGQRTSFSHQTSAEPLPPLRPSRARSLHEDPGLEAAPRHPAQTNNYGSQSYGYGRGYPHYPEPQQPQQTYVPVHDERSMSRQPPPPPLSGPYGGGPSQGYPTIYSPTTAHPHHHMVHSPPETHAYLPAGHFRHRSSGSISGLSIAPGDPNANKYRKLQPAPVPPHRAWANKPELKTIPYDHKYVGQTAELPNSGPTQIRGWNVNQHKRRARAEKSVDRHDPVNDREDSR